MGYLGWRSYSSYGSLEEQGLISPALCDAIEIELDISDLLFDGFKCTDEKLDLFYDQANCITKELTDFDRLALGAVGKHLWQKRVNSFDDPTQHPEYSPSMEQEIAAYYKKIESETDKNSSDIIHKIISSVDIPSCTQEAANLH